MVFWLEYGCLGFVAWLLFYVVCCLGGSKVGLGIVSVWAVCLWVCVFDLGFDGCGLTITVTYFICLWC